MATLSILGSIALLFTKVLTTFVILGLILLFIGANIQVWKEWKKDIKENGL